MFQNQKNSPHLPWKTRILIFFLSVVANILLRPNGTIYRRLISLFDVKVPPHEKQVKGVKTVDIIVDPSRDLWFRLFIPLEPPNDVTLPVIVFFHGGGFAFCHPDTWFYDAMCRFIARNIPAVIVSVNYRLAPEYRYPSQFEDGFDTLKFIDEKFDGFPRNADLSWCFLVGDSAGANLAHHVACQASKTEFRRVKLIGLIAIQPFFGGEERTESEIRLTNVPLLSEKRMNWVWKAFLPEGADKDHEAVNAFGPNSTDISKLNFPATVVFVAGFDPLQDWQRRYYKGLKKYGKEAYLVEYPDTIHAFYLSPGLPQNSQLIKDVRAFIQRQASTVSEFNKNG